MPLTIQVQRLIGLPVLQMSGKSVGKVKDVWLDEFWQLSGVILDTRVWFSKAVRAIRWTHVLSSGEDALLIQDRDAVETLEHKQLLRTFYCGIIRLKDMPVYTISGVELGRVADVYFKESEGTPLVGYELTDGFLADVLEGRRRLFLPEGPENVVLGEDSILVPSSSERVLTRDHTRKVTGEDG